MHCETVCAPYDNTIYRLRNVVLAHTVVSQKQLARVTALHKKWQCMFKQLKWIVSNGKHKPIAYRQMLSSEGKMSRLSKRFQISVPFTNRCRSEIQNILRIWVGVDLK